MSALRSVWMIAGGGNAIRSACNRIMALFARCAVRPPQYLLLRTPRNVAQSSRRLFGSVLRLRERHHSQSPTFCKRPPPCQRDGCSPDPALLRHHNLLLVRRLVQSPRALLCLFRPTAHLRLRSRRAKLRRRPRLAPDGVLWLLARFILLRMLQWFELPLAPARPLGLC